MGVTCSAMAIVLLVPSVISPIRVRDCWLKMPRERVQSRPSSSSSTEHIRRAPSPLQNE